VEFNEDLDDFNGGFLMFKLNCTFCTFFVQWKMYVVFINVQKNGVNKNLSFFILCFLIILFCMGNKKGN